MMSFLVLLGPIISRLLHVQMQKKQKQICACSSPISMYRTCSSCVIVSKTFFPFPEKWAFLKRSSTVVSRPFQPVFHALAHHVSGLGLYPNFNIGPRAGFINILQVSLTTVSNISQHRSLLTAPQSARHGYCNLFRYGCKLQLLIIY